MYCKRCGLKKSIRGVNATKCPTCLKPHRGGRQCKKCKKAFDKLSSKELKRIQAIVDKKPRYNHRDRLLPAPDVNYMEERLDELEDELARVHARYGQRFG